MGYEERLSANMDRVSQGVITSFGTSLYDDPKAVLKELKQVSTVMEYQTQFEEISTKVNGLSEAWLVSFFIAGLQDQLKCELLLA